jgi:sulfate adenylyltransferase subunit 2
MDIWQYILLDEIPIPDIYMAHRREVVNRRGILLAKTEVVNLLEGESVETRQVRFRTIGDATCTGAVESDEETISGASLGDRE